MFSTLSSILPSAINFGQGSDKQEKEKERDRERNQDVDNEITPRPANAPQMQEQEKESTTVAEEPVVRKKRERNPNETFIVVRPPPSVSNHPLNLQLQLVPPQAKERSVSGSSSASNYSTVSTRRSGEFSGGEELGGPLARTTSGRSTSNRSDPSLFYASSSTSLSSIASTTSSGTSGGRRMIVPLYNLSAHNVMTNTVLDAGTDAKVAKFHKRGMEVLALAVLECVEVWPSYGRGGAAQIAFLNATAAANTNPASTVMIGSNGVDASTLAATTGIHDSDVLLHTPTSSAISLSSNGSQQHQSNTKFKSNTLPEPVISSTPTKSSFLSRGSVTPTPTNGAKKLFGKIFKKKDSQNASSASDSRRGSLITEARLTVSPPPDADIGGTRSNRNSLSGPVPSPTPSHFSNVNYGGVTPIPLNTNTGLNVAMSGSGPGIQVQSVLQPPVLGIHPTLSAPLSPPMGRPTRYVWIVRKWLKGGDGGILGGVIRGVNNISVAAGMLADRAGGGSGFANAITNGNGNLQNNDSGSNSSEGSGVEVRFEWVRGQSKSQSQKRKAAGQGVLGKRGSASAGSSHEEGQSTQPTETESVPRSRRSVASETQAERVKAKSKSQTRAKSATPRASMESRRSVEKERESITSASVSEEVQQGSKNPGLLPAFEEYDDGEESDPEDSETPWTCTLIISSIPVNPAKLWELEYSAGDGLAQVPSRRSHMSNPPAEGSARPDTSQGPNASTKPPARPDAPGTLLKLKVGALSPAPHHPKVVAQLKVPYPLPDIEVEKARVRKRVITPSGIARPVSRGRENGGADEQERGGGRPTSSKGRMLGGGLGGLGGLTGNKARREGEDMEGTILTAEEIKDILSCTAFWVVVREGFGGVGKVSRKGDGWRIRG